MDCSVNTLDKKKQITAINNCQRLERKLFSNQNRTVYARGTVTGGSSLVTVVKVMNRWCIYVYRLNGYRFGINRVFDRFFLGYREENSHLACLGQQFTDRACVICWWEDIAGLRIIVIKACLKSIALNKPAYLWLLSILPGLITRKQTCTAKSSKLNCTFSSQQSRWFPTKTIRPTQIIIPK